MVAKKSWVYCKASKVVTSVSLREVAKVFCWESLGLSFCEKVVGESCFFVCCSNRQFEKSRFAIATKTSRQKSRERRFVKGYKRINLSRRQVPTLGASLAYEGGTDFEERVSRL